MIDKLKRVLVDMIILYYDADWSEKPFYKNIIDDLNKKIKELDDHRGTFK